MKTNNSAIGISIGFFALAILSFWTNVSIQNISVFSLCSLLFSIAQALESYINSKASESKAMIRAMDKLSNWNLTEVWKFIYEEYSYPYNAGRKDRILLYTSNIVECASFVVLILGLTRPISLFEHEEIGTFCTIASFSILFFSFWLVGRVEKNSQMWKDLTLIGMLLQQENINNPTTTREEDTDGQTENAQC